MNLNSTFLEPSFYVIIALWTRIEKKHRQNSHNINHFPTNEGVSKVSKRAAECASKVSSAEQANK